MNDEMPTPITAAALLNAYLAAAVEFNLGASPLILAMTAQLRPSDAEVLREETARAAVVEARRKVWALYEHRQDLTR